MPIICYLEVTIRRDFGKLDKFKKFEQNSVLYLDTIMRFTQNDLFRRVGPASCLLACLIRAIISTSNGHIMANTRHVSLVCRVWIKQHM